MTTTTAPAVVSLDDVHPTVIGLVTRRIGDTATRLYGAHDDRMPDSVRRARFFRLLDTAKTIRETAAITADTLAGMSDAERLVIAESVASIPDASRQVRAMIAAAGGVV